MEPDTSSAGVAQGTEEPAWNGRVSGWEAWSRHSDSNRGPAVHEKNVGSASRSIAACVGGAAETSRWCGSTTVASLVSYTLAQAPVRVVSASLGVTAP